MLRQRFNSPRNAQQEYLCFDSAFECGNLGKVVVLSQAEYDLYLNSDTNSNRQSQWFYFSVINTKKDSIIKFNIINQCKHFYKKGIKPLAFSLKDNYWSTDIDISLSKCENTLQNSYKVLLNEDGEDLSIPSKGYTMSFIYKFKYDNDKVYFAYRKPYSFTDLNRFLRGIEGGSNEDWVLPEITIERKGVYYKREILCYSLGGIPFYYITITSASQINNRNYVIITARVHPSETPGSHKLQGIVQFLLSGRSEAERLRNEYTFILIPMLNPDGVVLGNTRCSLGGYDLNRCWSNPSSNQPTILALKNRLQYLISKGGYITMYCDLHGHSKLLNSFVYACPSTLTQASRVRDIPRLIARRCLFFDYRQCSFRVESDRLTTARVVVWKELKASNSFTLETSMFGYIIGEDVKVFTEDDYLRIGEALLEALNDYTTLHSKIKHENVKGPVVDLFKEKKLKINIDKSSQRDYKTSLFNNPKLLCIARRFFKDSKSREETVIPELRSDRNELSFIETKQKESNSYAMYLSTARRGSKSKIEAKLNMSSEHNPRALHKLKIINASKRAITVAHTLFVNFEANSISRKRKANGFPMSVVLNQPISSNIRLNATIVDKQPSPVSNGVRLPLNTLSPKQKEDNYMTTMNKCSRFYRFAKLRMKTHKDTHNLCNFDSLNAKEPKILQDTSRSLFGKKLMYEVESQMNSNVTVLYKTEASERFISNMLLNTKTKRFSGNKGRTLFRGSYKLTNK